MNEYKITANRGFLDSKTFYVSAISAEEVQKRIEEELAFEISEGLTYKIELI